MFLKIQILAVGFIASLISVVQADDKYSLKTVEQKPPKQVAKSIREKLSNESFVVQSEKDKLCTIWFVKNLEVHSKFKPTLSVKYPFQSGQLIGVIQVSGKKQFTDFRGQEIATGVFTLRYGKQPEDGNHIGTSDLADFLLALPAKFDKNPKTISQLDRLHEQSAKSAGATHPAIYSLLPAEKKVEQSMTHDADNEFWILNVNLKTISKGKKRTLPLRVVLFGQSEA